MQTASSSNGTSGMSVRWAAAVFLSGLFFAIGMQRAEAITISWDDSLPMDQTAITTDIPNAAIGNCASHVPECMQLRGVVPVGTLQFVNGAAAYLIEEGTKDVVSDVVRLSITDLMAGQALIQMIFQSDLENGNLGKIPAGFTGIPETGGRDILNGEDLKGNIINRFQVNKNGMVVTVAEPRSFVVTAQSDIPEPGSAALFIGSSLMLALSLRWRRKSVHHE